MTEREMRESMAATGNRHIKTVYMAGKVTARERLKKYRGDIRYLGFKCTSSWLDFATDYPADFSTSERSHVDIAPEAIRDLAEIKLADLLIIDTQDVTETGGREFEAGYAYACGTQVWVVGPVRHLFHLRAHRKFDTWDGVIVALREITLRAA